MRCAVLCSRVDMLECLHDLKLQYEYEGEWTWGPNLMRIALWAAARRSQWISRHPKDTQTSYSSRMRIASRAALVMR